MNIIQKLAFSLFISGFSGSLLFAASLETVELSIKNMHCGLCTATLRKAIENVPGVKKASVDLSKKIAKVTYDQETAKVDGLIEAIAEAGCPSATLLKKTNVGAYSAEVSSSQEKK